MTSDHPSIQPPDSVPPLPAAAVFGADGFIGGRLYAGLRRVNPNTAGFSRRRIGGMLPFDLSCPDITGLDLVRRGITHAVIAAGITGVAACEQNPAAARGVNVEGTVELARQLTAEGVRTIALSSDYVFDGTEGGYDEQSPVNPLNEYGRQKADMERELLRVCGGNVLIVRLSKVVDSRWGSGTLLDEMAGKMVRGIPVSAAHDQIFCPTAVDDVIVLFQQLLMSGMSGIVHLCSPIRTSRLHLAQKVADAFGCDPDLVRAISLHELGETFARPLNTSMTSAVLRSPAGFRTVESCIGALKQDFDAVQNKIPTLGRGKEHHGR